MTTRLLTAPAAAGKTHYCITRLQQIRRDDPLLPIRVVLSDTAQVAAFRNRLAVSGGAIGVHVGTFYGLYAELLAAAGPVVPPRLDEPVRHRLLRQIVDELCAAGSLHFYTPLADKPGFYRALVSLIRELKRARLTTAKFADAVAGHGARLEELAAIYAAYQAWLTREGWSDAEGLGWLAVRALEDDAALGVDWRLLVVDGFGQLDPTQLEVLHLLAPRVGECIVTLTGADTTTTRLVHRRFDRIRPALEAALGLRAEPLTGTRVRLAPPLAALEVGLFEAVPGAPDVSGDDGESGATATPAEATGRGPEVAANTCGETVAGAAAVPDAAGGPAVERDAALELVEAPTLADEVRAALRWLKMRIVEDGLAPAEVAVLARDLESYRPYLEEVAAEFGLPLDIATAAQLVDNPAIAALLDLLALPVEDWPRRLVVEAWRSPYFDWSTLGIGAGDAAQLEAAARHGQVIGGLAQWRETLDRLAEATVEGPARRGGDGGRAAGPGEGGGAVLGAGEDGDTALGAGEDSDAAPFAGGVPFGAAAAVLRARLDAFAVRMTPAEAATIRHYAAWLEDLIGDDPGLATKYQPRDPAIGAESMVARARFGPDGARLPTAERDVAALRSLKDALRGLVFAESVLGGPVPAAVSFERFRSELAGVVEAASYDVPPAAGCGAVLAAPVLAARGLTFRAVALLGLSEGQFPQAPAEDPLLHEPDRIRLAADGLALDTPLLSDEVTLLYEAVTRAAERLLVTRPYLAGDGSPWQPSPYWGQLVRHCPEPRRVRPEDPLPPREAASWPELLAAVAQAEARMAAGSARIPEPLPPTGRAGSGRVAESASVGAGSSTVGAGYSRALASDPRWRAVTSGAAVLAARMAAEATGAYEGDLAGLSAALERSYGNGRRWSASRLEAYAACPHNFFAAYCLDLEPRQPARAGFDARQLGSMLHAILEEVYRRQMERGRPAAELLAEVADEEFDAAPEQYGFRPTPLWAQQRRELSRDLARTVAALEAASVGWAPAHFEAAFGLHGAPELVLRGDDGQELILRGYIDRVDSDGAGALRVIDYKTGSAPISPRDLAEGKRVQLALYARAAGDALGMGEPAAGMYWHISSAKPSALKLESYEGGGAAAMDTAARHALAHAAAVRRGAFAPRPPTSGCPGWCPAADYCWRYSAPVR